ncbi:MAG: hypothetical protein AAF598_22555, partial [Bacteroidota bacterium]
LNMHSKWTLGKWFNGLIKYVIPAILTLVIVTSLWEERGGLYGSGGLDSFTWLPVVIPIFWLLTSIGFAYFLTRQPYEE